MPLGDEVRILVSVDAKDPAPPSTGLIDLLSPQPLVILGYWEVPDQSSTAQLRSQFGEEATVAIDDIASQFTDAGSDVETVVVFTHDVNETAESVAAEHDVYAVLTADPFATDLEHILVPLRGDDNLERTVAFVGRILRRSQAKAILFNVADSEEQAQTGEFILRGAIDKLEEIGVNPDRLAWEQVRDNAPGRAITEVGTEYDLIVVGESEPTLRERILGGVTNTVISKAPAPVLVVRRP